MYSFRFIRLIPLLFIPLSLISCDILGSDEDSGPVIEAIKMNPQNLTTEDGSATFTVIATHPDGKDMTFTWSASAGELSVPTGEDTLWFAPGDTYAQPGIYTIECTANDGKGTTTKSKTFELSAAS